MDTKELQALLNRHGFRFTRSMGQNFLTDLDILRDIAAASGADRSCGVLEIGPGAGTLTGELARRAGKVVSVELDRALLPVLSETAGRYENVTILNGDALKLDLAALAEQHFRGLTPIVCANIPYNITTPLLEKLTETPCFRSLTVLVQKEVAERLSARPGSPDTGAFALWFQYHMETERVFNVPREKFLPPPKVDSALLRCVRRDRPAVRARDEARFFRVVRGAFLLRRKTLPNCLSAALGIPKEAVREALRECGLPENIRGEALTLEQFADLSERLAF